MASEATVKLAPPTVPCAAAGGAPAPTSQADSRTRLAVTANTDRLEMDSKLHIRPPNVQYNARSLRNYALVSTGL